MKIKILSLLFIFISQITFSQSYTSYFKGDTSDVITSHLKGTLLAGGASDNDEAMMWFLNRADGGDVVVLRATGDDGYNVYLYSELGVTVNSVETIVIPNSTAANDPYVSAQIKNAEALFIAGGDQYDYIENWKDSPIEDALNYLINTKLVTIGGTSAGMAIQGEAYFSAQNGTVTSQQAMNNPYSNLVKLGYQDFLANPILKNTITDSHYNNPDRRGRQTAFLARLMADFGFRSFGIACNEYTAVCIDENNIAHIYGYYPDYDDYAYFLQANCEEPNEPEICAANEPLTWDRSNAAVKVYKATGTTDGNHYFDLNDWKSNDGSGTWENWFVEDGGFNSQDEMLPADCEIETTVEEVNSSFQYYPNPTSGELIIDGIENSIAHIAISDLLGRIVFEKNFLNNNGSMKLDLSSLPAGLYVLKIEVNQKTTASFISKK